MDQQIGEEVDEFIESLACVHTTATIPQTELGRWYLVGSVYNIRVDGALLI